jgi:hypothetical protein
MARRRGSDPDLVVLTADTYLNVAVELGRNPQEHDIEGPKRLLRKSPGPTWGLTVAPQAQTKENLGHKTLGQTGCAARCAARDLNPEPAD